MSGGIGSFCSGVGGLDLAVETVTGLSTVWQAEIDADASTVLSERFGVPNHGDVTATDWGTVEPVEAVCFGFPCQDISTAGRGAGITEGTRSGLFFDCWAAVRVLRPRLVVMENVPAILARRPGIDVVADQMAGDGYDFRWCCVRASDVGAPHRRNRWFCVAADRESAGRQGTWVRGRPPEPGAGVADADGVVRERAGQPRRRRSGPADRDLTPSDAGGDIVRPEPFPVTGSGDQVGTRLDRQAVADTEGERGQDRAIDGALVGVGSVVGAGRGDDDRRTTEGVRELGRAPGELAASFGPYTTAVTRWERTLGRRAPNPRDDAGRLNPRFVEWMQGFPDGWVTDLIPRRPALRCLGNAVVTLQAVAALEQLARIEVAA